MADLVCECGQKVFEYIADVGDSTGWWQQHQCVACGTTQLIRGIGIEVDPELAKCITNKKDKTRPYTPGPGINRANSGWHD